MSTLFNPNASTLNGSRKRTRFSKVLVSCVFISEVMLSLASAYAIECQGNYQVQANGNLIATPYCEDHYLAEVAREYRISTCADCIRSSFIEKEAVCKLLQFDNRVWQTCSSTTTASR